MLSPKRVKYRKVHKGRIKGIESRGNYISFGKYGLQAVGSGRLTARQIESARRAIIRQIRKVGKLWIRIFPDIPVTSKPTEVRMGKGKGSLDYWSFKVRPGRVLYEISDVPIELAKSAFKSGSYKLPMKTKFIVSEKKGL